MPTQLIVTADDFGKSPEVNEAVEVAHRNGILTSASLMVAGAAVEDAISRARRLPKLAVGLHLALVNAKPLCDPRDIVTLTDKTGTLKSATAMTGLGHFLYPTARRQLRREIAEQFRAFRATGLVLDHVNAHHHYHLHPTVGAEMLGIGHDYGLTAVRLPFEPQGPTPGSPLALRPWIFLLRRRLERARIRRNDFLHGISWSGAMTAERVCRILGWLPPGLHEIYFHPEFDGPDPNTDLAALTDMAVRECIVRNQIELTSFGIR